MAPRRPKLAVTAAAAAAATLAVASVSAPTTASAYQFRSVRSAPLAAKGVSASTASASAAAGCRFPLFSASAASDLTDLNSVSSVGDLAAEADMGGDSELGPRKAKLVKIGVTSFVLSMCLALPVTLFPVWALHKLNVIDQLKKEQLSLKVGQFCSRWNMRLIPFCTKSVTPSGHREDYDDPQPSVWVCNHTSMLDVFVLLAADKKMRGRKRRDIKIVYWKGLESNPVTKLLFTMCGFIAVEMADNGNGTPNDYDRSSFKKLLIDVKKAFQDGFDVGILPEGQLNPTPEAGLLPVFSGAHSLARMSRRPVRMMALSGVNGLWHPTESMGVTGRNINIRVYPPGKKGGVFESGDEFVETFTDVVGHFGSTGRDLPEENLAGWLDGTMWENIKERKAASDAEAEVYKSAVNEAKAEEMTSGGS